MKRPLVIGIGNALRGDDGFGPAFVARMREAGWGERAELLAVHQLTPELVFDLERATSVAFVDASAELAPGVRTELDLVADPLAPRWTHHFDAGHLLALANEALGTSPPARVFAVGAACFDEGTGLTPQVRAQCVPVLRSIVGWWDELSRPAPHRDARHRTD